MKTVTDCLKDRNYVFVDVETTGASAINGQIIEIGIIRVENGSIVETFQTLIQPDRPISNLITQITGITIDDLAGKPTFDEVALHIQELLSDAIFVAHNARFDYGFVKNEFKRLNIAWDAKTVCTVKVSRALYPNQRSHSLATIIATHTIPVLARHRAFDDAEVMLKFLQRAELDHSSDTVRAVISTALGSHSLPATIDSEMIKALPHAPGVYFFYDKDDALLYVGKSVDIKNRVRSHFTQAHTSTKEAVLTQLVSHIDYETTSGELSALLREAALIKELSPAYNRRLRKMSRLAVFKRGTDASGYMSGSLFYQDTLDIVNVDYIDGIFRTMAEGTAVINGVIEEFQLCPKLLGLEKGKGCCFQFHLGNCKGACIKEEAPEEYNKRFVEAFKNICLKSWPFPGPITVEEDPGAEEGSAFVIDQWRILKKIDYTAEGYSETHFDQPFDYDTYRILSKHFIKH
ncbi:3'-5' exoribonuclease [Patescibacteria group bacterium]|nr:3'-5' exoribonuclease [Patescibacteria group bacterium]